MGSSCSWPAAASSDKLFGPRAHISLELEVTTNLGDFSSSEVCDGRLQSMPVTIIAGCIYCPFLLNDKLLGPWSSQVSPKWDTSSKGLLHTAWLLFLVCKHLQGRCARALKCIQHCGRPPSLRKHGYVAIPQETLSEWSSVNSIFVCSRVTQQSCSASPQAALEAGCHWQPHNKANCFHVELPAFHASSQ